MTKDIEVTGVHHAFSKPFGIGTTCHRDEWYVSRKLTPEERLTPIQRIFKSKCLGKIINPDRTPERFVISQLFPAVEFNTLQKAIDFLIENEDKLVFCT